MGNGRKFTRNRKGSPNKSQRRARQRANAQAQANFVIQQAVDSAVRATAEALDGAIKTAADSLAKLSNLSPDDVEKVVREEVEKQRATDDG